MALNVLSHSTIVAAIFLLKKKRVVWHSVQGLTWSDCNNDSKGPFTLSISDPVSIIVSDAKIMGTEYYQWYHSHWP